MSTDVLLLCQNESYADCLAHTLRVNGSRFDVDVVSGAPVKDRISAVRRGYDLIHVDGCFHNGPLAAGAKPRSTKLVTAFRGWADYTNAHGEYSDPKVRTIRARTKFTASRSSRLISFGRLQAEILKGEFGFGDMAITGRPINVGQYYTDRRVNGPNLTVSTVTNLRYLEKAAGVVLILSALEPLFDEYDNLTYRVAGDGENKDRVIEYLDNYGHRNRVSMHGWVDDIQQFLSASDIFVYASSLDAYPTSILEAQAARLPVVAVAQSGLPDVVGEAGELCGPTPEAVCRRVRRLIESPQERRRLSDLSKKKMEDHNRITTESHVEAWEEALE